MRTDRNLESFRGPDVVAASDAGADQDTRRLAMGWVLVARQCRTELAFGGWQRDELGTGTVDVNAGELEAAEAALSALALLRRGRLGVLRDRWDRTATDGVRRQLGVVVAAELGSIFPLELYFLCSHSCECLGPKWARPKRQFRYRSAIRQVLGLAKRSGHSPREM